MCYDSDARPPDLPETGGTAHGEDIVLSASDGNRFAAYVAQPDKPSGAQIVLFPDVRGLHQFYKELALRFAESGTKAVAIDYFGRTAGLSARDDSFEYRSHVQQLQVPNFFKDVSAALAYLRTGKNVSSPTFTVGFCLGGSFSLLAGTQQDLGLAGIVGFYAGLSRTLPGSDGSILELATESKYPVLGLFGGADQGIPVSQVNQLDENLDQAGVEHTIITYPGAPHSFFDRKAVEYADASTDAWKRVLGFIGTGVSK